MIFLEPLNNMPVEFRDLSMLIWVFIAPTFLLIISIVKVGL